MRTFKTFRADKPSFSLNEIKIIRLFSADFGYYNNKEAGSMSSILMHCQKYEALSVCTNAKLQQVKKAMTEENKEIEKQNTAGNKKRKIAGFTINVRRSLTILFIILCIFIFNVLAVCAEAKNKKSEKNMGFEILKHSYGQTAVVLNENEIFLPCNCSESRLDGMTIEPAQIYDIKNKKFNSLNSYMNTPRILYITAKLDDGRILIFGGTSCNLKQDISYIAEIYDPKTNTFKTIGPTISKKYNVVNTSFIKLKDGRLLITFGSLAEIFDPKIEKFYIAGEEQEYYQKSILDYQGTKKQVKTTQNIYNARVALALLNDGRVLLAGANYDKNPGNAEIYDPKTNSFTKTKDQIYPRFYRDATTLNDGRVLLTGGTGVYYGYSFDKKRTTKPIAGNAEIFDPKTNTFTSVSPLNVGRSQHRSILLSNGKVLITGGVRGVDMDGVTKDELFDPETGTFKTIPSAKLERYAFNIEPLSENKIFINSYNGWEIFKY